MQRYRITTPDGVFELTAENDEAITAAVNQMFAGGSPGGAPAPSAPTAPAPAAAPPKERSWLDAITGPITQAAIGAREGLAAIPDLGVAAINNAPRLLNALPGVSGVGPISDKPVTFSDMLAAPVEGVRSLFGMTAKEPAPANMTERFAKRIGVEAGAAALPVGAVMTKANQGAQAVRESGALMRALGLEKAAVSPTAYLRGEGAMSTAAGAGAATVNEATRLAGYKEGSGVQQAGDLAGAIGGVGVASLARGAGPVLSNVIGAATGNEKIAGQVVADGVVDAIMKAAGETVGGDSRNLVNAIQGGPRVSDVIPGFQDTLATRTKNAGLSALELSRQTGPNAGEFILRADSNARAVDRAVESTAPTGRTADLRGSLENRRDAVTGYVADLRGQADNEAAAATAPLAPTSTVQDRGNIIRAEIKDAKGAARANTKAAYDAVDDLQNVPLRSSDLIDAIDRGTKGLTVIERRFLPETDLKRLRDFAESAEGQTVTLAEADSLRQELRRMQTAALADNNAERGGRNAGRVIGRLADEIDGLVTANLTPEQSAKFTAARKAAFDEKQTFDRAGNPLSAADSRYIGGAPRVSDERLARSFADPQAMQTLFASVDTPAARAAVKDEILSRARLETPEGVRTFINEYGQQIGRFPGLRAELETAFETRAAQKMAGDYESDVMKAIGPQGRSAVAKYLEYGDENAHKAIRTVINAKDPARAADELLSFVGNDAKAVSGAQKAVWDVMETKAKGGEQGRWNPALMKRFLSDPGNAAVLERIYKDNPEHLTNVRNIIDAAESVNLRSGDRAAAVRNAMKKDEPGLRMESVQSGLWAVERGQVSPVFFATRLVGLWARRAIGKQQADAFQNAVDRALRDPEWAALLLKENNPANRAALKSGARAWMGNQAATLGELLVDESDDEKLKRRIMENR